MHVVARHLTKNFKSQTPKGMRDCFQYDHVYVTTINEQLQQWRNLHMNHFAKLINNGGEKAKLLEDADDTLKD